MAAVSQNFCSNILQFGIFFLGAFLAIRGDITTGTVLIFFNLCNFIIMPINVVPQYWASRRAAVGLIKKISALAAENTTRSGEAIAPVLKKAILFNDVSFGYGGNPPILHNVNLQLETGKKYALVGTSGSGKSTIINLLMGAYDTYSGSITIDGQNLRDLNPNSLYNLISLIDQNVFIFNDTIYHNITMFQNFSADRVELAISRSGLADLVKNKGADYCCGENGVGLSGGERQRVSIARCLLRETPVLLLDEATASLDTKTAFDVINSILKLDGLTRLVVTHHLEPALLEQYDEIIVLRNGVVCEKGQYEDLMSRRMYLYSLYHVANE